MAKIIALTKNKVALVDDEDYGWLSQWKWRAEKKRHYWYAVRTFYFKDCTKRVIYMHTLIMAKHFGHFSQVDHRNHNTLDNRKKELRAIIGRENQWNMIRHTKNASSKYKGVSWSKHAAKWHCQIGYNKKMLHIGYYDNEKDAANAYDDKAREYFGESACLNLPVSSNLAQQRATGAMALEHPQRSPQKPESKNSKQLVLNYG